MAAAKKSARTIAHEARIVTRAVIYLLTEVTTGRHYVGQARDFETRMRGHLIGRVAPFDLYLRQVGRGAFRETILEVVEGVTQRELNEAETFWIRELDAMDPKGFNRRFGGAGGALSEEAKKAIRDGHARRRLMDPEGYAASLLARSVVQKKRFEDPAARRRSATRTEERSGRRSSSRVIAS